MELTSKIFVAGHRGLVGSAIVRCLRAAGYSDIVTRTHAELDLTNQEAVAEFFALERPEYVFLAAAKVGGIMANSLYRGEFIYKNLMIQSNVIHSAYMAGVRKLLFLGSTCIYPRDAPQPMAEDCLLTSPLEYTNEPYAIAKIAGIKMCESYNLQYGTNFISVMPTNLYGPGDNFDLQTSHVMPALIRKFYLGAALMRGDWRAVAADFDRMPVGGVDGSSREAMLAALSKCGVRVVGDPACLGSAESEVQVEIWGSGTPLREFLWSEDMAAASVYVMEHVEWSDLARGMVEPRNCHINIGSGVEVSIAQLAEIVARATGFSGSVVFDATKPDGTMRKLTDTSKIEGLGWRHTVSVEQGVAALLDWYVSRA